MNSKQREELQRVSAAITTEPLPNGLLTLTCKIPLKEIKRIVDTILAEPVKNCEVGSVEEQAKRWEANCGRGIPNCQNCKVYEQAKKSGLVHRRYLMRCDCKFIWSQMPYEEGETK